MRESGWNASRAGEVGEPGLLWQLRDNTDLVVLQGTEGMYYTQ